MKDVVYYKARLNTIRARGKNHDCPGVEKKLVRQIRNAEKKANK